MSLTEKIPNCISCLTQVVCVCMYLKPRRRADIPRRAAAGTRRAAVGCIPSAALRVAWYLGRHGRLRLAPKQPYGGKHDGRDERELEQDLQ